MFFFFSRAIKHTDCSCGPGEEYIDGVPELIRQLFGQATCINREIN